MIQLAKQFQNYLCYSLSIILACCIFVCLPGVSAQANERVLFISSYSYDWPSVPNQINGIKAALGNGCAINYLFMDAKMTDKAAMDARTYRQMQTLQQIQQPYDVVILGDDDALDFVRQYRQEFFATVPVIYEGINSQGHARAAHEEGMTGIIETLPLESTINAAKQIMPGAKRVVAILDNTTSGQGGLAQYLSEQGKFPGLDFQYILTSDYSAEELGEKLSEYGNDTILLEMIFTNDKDGNRYTGEQGAEFISSHARIPVFNATEIGMGSGYLGGVIIDSREMGYKAGVMAAQVLRDQKSPAEMEPEIMPGRAIFDQRVMDRFHIRNSLLPADAQIIHEPQNFFWQYKLITIPAVLVFALLVIWLLREISNNRKRKQMLAELASKSAMMHIALDQSGLHVWEYFPDLKQARINQDFNHDLALGSWLDNYPDAWIHSDNFYPGDIPVFQNMMEQMGRDVAEAACEVRVKFTDGKWHWVRVRFFPVYDKQGQCTEWIGTAENIDDYKALEERFLISMGQCGISAWVYDIIGDAVIRDDDNHENMFAGAPESGFPDSLLQQDFVYPDDGKRLCRLYEQVKSGAKTAETTIRWKFPAGVYRWIRIVYSVIFDAEGRPVKAFGTAIDVNEQKRNEERFNTELQRAIAMEGETRASFHVDLNTGKVYQWIYEGQSYLTETFTWKEGVDRSGAFIPDEAEQDYYLRHLDRQYLLAQFELGNDRFTMEYRCRTTDDAVIWVRTYVYMAKQYDTHHVMAYAFTRDIDKVTANKLAIDSIVDEEVEFISIIDVATQAERILKSRAGDMMEGITCQFTYRMDTLLRTIVAEDRALAKRQYALPAILATLEEAETCIGYYRKMNEHNEVCRKRTVVYYLDETKETLVYICADITALYAEEQRQKRRLEKALKQAEKASRAKSDFLSHMSHEIRTPMNAVIGLATLVSERANDAGYVATNIEKINASAHFLLTLINDILDISRIESGRMELNEDDVLFDGFVAMIDTLIQSSADEKHVRYESVREGTLAEAYHMDELKLKQVLINILSNAVKFTPAGGSVTLRIEKYGSDHRADYIRFTISDTGIGIAPEFLPKVFDAFTQEYGGNTTLYGGTGLGLAISKNIVHLMKGKISVVSTKGEGTTFTVKIALQRATHIPAGTGNAAARLSRGLPYPGFFAGKRVLLVEDNEINREIAKTILEEGGFTVMEAVNGQEAVDCYRGHATGYFDAILMDIRMPVMDGLTATRQIRALPRDDAQSIPIIAMTANAFEEDVKKSLAAGMDAHLSKPVETEVLFDKLMELMAR